MFAHSKCTEGAFSSLPRQVTAQSLMNTHCLGNFMFPRRTCSFPFPVGRKSPCCALLKNSGSEQTWVAICTAGSDCCCHLRWGPSCICCYIWKNHWGKLFWFFVVWGFFDWLGFLVGRGFFVWWFFVCLVGVFFCKWTLQSWASLVLSQFLLCKTLGGVHLYKWIQSKMNKSWSDPIEAEPSGTASD